MKIRISHVMALGIVLSEAALLPQAVAGVPPSTQHATSRDANARDAAQSKLDHTKAMDSLYIGALFGTQTPTIVGQPIPWVTYTALD